MALESVYLCGHFVAPRDGGSVMASLRTPLCDLLGIEYPIVQAPMAGGPTTPELVGAVSAAGALGSFGHAYTPPATIREDAAAVRARTEPPVQPEPVRRAPPR